MLLLLVSFILMFLWMPELTLLFPLLSCRFNATDFLVRIRGKRLMLVGDSMNRNQFESMLCLLYEGLPDKSKMYEVHGYKITKGRGFYIFKFVVIAIFICLSLQLFRMRICMVIHFTC